MVSRLRLFWELFKIALFVVGGGYAILVVADEVFGRKLRWLREGELLEHLPVFQMVPGLIAGNTAIYVGLKTAGRAGAALGLVAVALPSYLIFMAVSAGLAWLPVENPGVAGALAGLRAGVTGLVLGTLVRGWRNSVRGVYGYATVLVAGVLLVGLRLNPAWVLLMAMGTGLAWTYAGGRVGRPDESARGVALAPRTRRARFRAWGCTALVLGAAAVWYGEILWTFLRFGLLGFGGGFVLVPLYETAFVGASAPSLQLTPETFSNIVALTQATPGPVSVNMATFCGFRLGGAIGAAVATAALLLPSYFLLTGALGALEAWRKSRLVQGILWGVRPATNALLVSALVCFARMSVWTPAPAGWTFHPCAAVLALAVACALRRLSAMALILGSGALGVLVL